MINKNSYHRKFLMRMKCFVNILKCKINKYKIKENKKNINDYKYTGHKLCYELR